MKKKIYNNKIIYIKLIIELADEIRISLKESEKIVDFVLSILKPIKIDYLELKKEIISFLTFNMFSLISKFK